MRKIILLALTFLISGIYPIGVVADDCRAILELSRTSSETILDNGTFDQEIQSLCRAYSQFKESSRSQGGSFSYSGLSMGGSGSRASAESIARNYCSFGDSASVKESAYRQYIRSVAPGAYSAYLQCKALEGELKVNLLGHTSISTSIRVAFDPSQRGRTASIEISTSEGVSCSWRGDSGSDAGDGTFPLSAGEAKTVRCNRPSEASAQSSFIAIVDTNSARSDAFVNLPWGAYSAEGLPISRLKALQDATQRMENLAAQLQDSVIAFAASSCPEGFEPYSPAFGRFVRGLDPSGSLDAGRAPGSHQEDSVKRHVHGYSRNGGTENRRAGTGNNNFDFNAIMHGDAGPRTGPNDSAGSETRPKNVALLYCTPVAPN